MASDEVGSSNELSQQNMMETYLNLEKIDVNIFRSQKLTGIRQVYGGQVIGQAMVAAGKTVPDVFHLHSLHCYFIKKGIIDIPILYIVDRVRDGRSFCTRYVQAVQEGNKIFACELSFVKEEPHHLNHQPRMPDVAAPEQLDDVSTLIRGFLTSSDGLSERQRTQLQRRLENSLTATEWSVDVRPADPAKYVRMITAWDGRETPTMLTWVKSRGKIGDDARLQHCAAAYISDMFMVPTAMQPVHSSGIRVGMTLSLDHSMWFHKYRFRMDEWVLFETECPVGGDDARLQHYVSVYISDMFMVPTVMQPVHSSGIRVGMTLSLDHSMWFHKYRFRMDEWVLFETECPAGDMFMVPTAMQPVHSRGIRVGMTLSLVHSMWFHKYRFRMDEWVLFETEYPVGAFGRSIIFGRMYTRDGELILTCAQEGLIRAKL